MTTHYVIPDTQAAPGRDSTHMSWIGNYIVDRSHDDPDVKIIHVGDHADMPSLSNYNSKLELEGKRYWKDIEAANESWDKLNEPFEEYNARKRVLKEKQWHPPKFITLGNHEDHITRAIGADPRMEGFLSLDHLDYARTGWEVHKFQEIIDLDGIWYSHYFYNPMSGNPWGGGIDNRLSKVGHSFTQGHAQIKMIGERYVGPQRQRAIVAGACYTHEENYKGPQGNYHWRGILVCHEVRDGSYDLMEVSLDYLCRRYEGISLDDFVGRKGLR